MEEVEGSASEQVSQSLRKSARRRETKEQRNKAEKRKKDSLYLAFDEQEEAVHPTPGTQRSEDPVCRHKKEESACEVTRK